MSPSMACGTQHVTARELPSDLLAPPSEALAPLALLPESLSIRASSLERQETLGNLEIEAVRRRFWWCPSPVG